jgi:hypothetical protein
MAVVQANPNAYGKRKVAVFHTEPEQRDVMGYALTAQAEGDVIEQGTPIVANDNDTNGRKTAVICKYAKIKSKTSNTKFVFEDVAYLKVGDKIFKSGQASPELSEISAINTKTGEITLKAANAQFAAGDIILEGKSEGENVVPAGIPNRIVLRTEKLKANDKTISATHRAVAIKNVLDYPAEYLNTTAFPGSTLLAGCPLILFINQ